MPLPSSDVKTGSLDSGGSRPALPPLLGVGGEPLGALPRFLPQGQCDSEPQCSTAFRVPYLSSRARASRGSSPIPLLALSASTPPPRFQAAGHRPAGQSPALARRAPRLLGCAGRAAKSSRSGDGLDSTMRWPRPHSPSPSRARVRPDAPRPTGARRYQRRGRRPRPCTLERSRHTRSPGSGGARPPTGRGTPPPHSSAMHSASSRPAAPAPCQPFSPPDFGVGALGVGAPDARTRLVVVWIDAAGGGPSGRRPPPQPRAGPGDGQR